MRLRSLGLLALLATLAIVQATGASAPRWQIMQTEDTGFAASTGFYSIDCADEDWCLATGALGGYTLAQHWDGVRWRLIPSPTPIVGVEAVPGRLGGFSDVSCPERGFCMAIGAQYYNHSAPAPPNPPPPPTVSYGASWDGVRWRMRPPLSPTDSSYLLRSVSCASPRFCLAVGDSEGRAVAQVWRGERWALLPIPRNLAGGVSLNGVSCGAVNVCTAVGSSFSSSSRTSILRWSDRKWSTLRVPVPRGSEAMTLVAVDCWTGDDCVAGGVFWRYPHNDVVALRLHGARWRVQETPSVWHTADVREVSCGGPRLCLVVGALNGPPGEIRPLAMSWDGTEWRLDRPPVPAYATRTEFSGVACAKGGVCFAAGESDETMLVERFEH